jgi:23S rRNA pseudouridine1911/1915/1917 synthase
VASEETSEVTLDTSAAGLRLDVSLAKAFPERSRSFLTRLLKDGAILLNGKEAKPSYRVRGGERIEVEWPEPESIEARPEAIPLDILFEDADVIAVNKPAGMCAHPSAGHTSGTLVNALLHHCADLSSINGAIRPGIVHRLDADTTGVIIAAKNDVAHQALQDQFMARTVRKTYVALCHGTPMHDRFTCDGRIGRHPVRRMEMTIIRSADEGRAAKTDFEVLQRFKRGGGTAGGEPRKERGGQGNARDVFLVVAHPHTGRTHQIRVHLAKSGYPVLADLLYGSEESLPELGLARHALHAWKLEIEHPRTRNPLRLEAPLADDMKNALRVLGGRWPPP